MRGSCTCRKDDSVAVGRCLQVVDKSLEMLVVFGRVAPAVGSISVESPRTNPVDLANREVDDRLTRPPQQSRRWSPASHRR